MYKKITAGLLAALMIFGGGTQSALNATMDTAMSVSAAETTVYGDFEYVLQDNGTVEITKYNGNDAEVKIPDRIDGKAVTSIGEEAFAYCSGIISVTMTDSVTEIGAGAFYECENLTTVRLSNSITKISDGTFNECSNLNNVTIPDGVSSIEAEAFRACNSLEKITIPDKVTVIEESTFFSC